MKTTVRIANEAFEIALDSPIDISIPLQFSGPQPNAFGVEPATSKACEYGSLVGDTRRGGSVNFEQYTLIPHCNGTHTECVGHITNQRISVRECLKDIFIPAVLISVEPEGYHGDLVITAGMLGRALTPQAAYAGGTPALQSLIVRTLPNNESKITREYGERNIPPYFTTEAMELVVEFGFKHLLVDLPSLDRLFDDGKLANHRVFWNVEPGSFEINSNTRMNATITEFTYVPSEIEDGEYLLNLQIAPFASDAAPSRPVLFKLQL